MKTFTTLITLLLLTIITACGETMAPTSPSSATTVLDTTSAMDASPNIGTERGGGPVLPQLLATSGPTQSPDGTLRFSWYDSQYLARLTLTNNRSTTMRGLLAVFRTAYAPGHAEFLYTQTLYKPGLQETVSPARTSRVWQPYALPDSGCWQTDWFPNLTKAQVLANPGMIDPTPRPGKIHEWTWKFGKHRSASGSCSTNVTPPPPPPPPATYTVCHQMDWPLTLTGLTEAEANFHLTSHPGDYAGACAIIR